MLPSTTSKVTTDHQEIRHWAEARGAKPAAVVGGESDDGAGVIRLDLPGQSGDGSLEEIGWDEWFNQLDKHNLALLYQEQTAGGENSNFNQIVSRETAEEAHSAVGGKGRSAAHQRPAKSAKKAAGPRPHGEPHPARREQKGGVRTITKPGSARVRASRSRSASPRRRAGEKRPVSCRHAGTNLKEIAEN